VRDAFSTVKLLEDANWDGMRHFDAHPYRTETAEGVWDFAAGCMRSYLILRDKARRFHDDAEIQEALEAAMVARLAEPTSPGGAGPDAIAALRRGPHDVDTLAAQGYGIERLDQLVTELLLGVR
jgi:xylose isomerase